MIVMRVKAARNAEKNTPSPSAKRGRRGTPRGTPKSAKKVSDLKPEVSCDPHVSTEEKEEEPIEKDDSRLSELVCHPVFLAHSILIHFSRRTLGLTASHFILFIVR